MIIVSIETFPKQVWVQHAGISVCLSIEGNVNIPEHVGALNIVSSTKWEIDAIIKEDRECIRN